ncbi:fungal-specific transcription factor domain-containing protein [Aspergillus carlsbadensis]|nr:fungal-specific transcription factor domain-containing protein [Aspergillus carlsbadensis]
MDPARPLKRVSRACDYCRKKRLYGATCSTSDPRAAENQHPGPSTGDKRTQEAAGIGQPSEPVPQSHAQSQPQPEPELDPELSILHSRTEVTPDFDQYAQELGLVFAPYCPPQSPPPLALNHGFDTDDGFSTLASYPAQLPSPRLSDGAPSHPVFQGLDLGRTVNSLDMAPPPPRPAHELFLRKGSADTKFIGMGSVGSTISECLRYGSMESAILAHLVNGIRHVDELSLPTAVPLPPLPDRDLAERGIRTYHERLHLLYPIIEVEFLDGWRQIYDEAGGAGTLSPVAYCRLCLVVLVGNIVSPQRGGGEHWEAAQRLHQQTWSLLGQVMASAFMESMQVMLLHTLFLLYCGKTGIAWMTCGMAVHIAQSLGLHQHPAPQLELTARQIDMRSKLWSVAYALDAFLSLSEGRPSSITGSPPSLASSFFTSLSHPSSYRAPQSTPTKPPAAQIHEWLVRLAAIASSVVSLLKTGDSPPNTLTQIGEIDTHLLAWKDSIPMELRPDQQILADDPVYSAIAMLHLKYHNLMRTIHWVSLTLSTTEDNTTIPSSSLSSSTPRPNPRLHSSATICLASSRSIIDVLNASSARRILNCPGGSAGGFIVPYCMAAISTFYRQILKEPRRHGARTDLELMRNGTLHVAALLDRVRPRSHFRALFEKMLRVAEEVVCKVGAGGGGGE